MKIGNNTEMTLRAVVDGKVLGKVKLPEAIELSRAEAEHVAAWARPFSGTCLTDLEIHVSDIRPSAALTVLSDLTGPLAKRIRPMLNDARRHGFGLRVMRETPSDPYYLGIYRRCIDVPQLTITARALQTFLDALGFLMKTDSNGETPDATVSIDVFAERLSKKYTTCMDLGVAHYREYCQRIVEYGRANGATEIVWGPERRGAVTEPVIEEGAEADSSPLPAAA